MRDTSAEAYRIIVTNGTVSRSYAHVYDLLYRHGPLTRNEIDNALSGGGPNPNYSRRLVEMERRGLIKRVQQRPCRITNYVCDAWDVTSDLPSSPTSKKSTRPNKDERAELLPFLREYQHWKQHFNQSLPESFTKLVKWLESMR